LAGSDIKDASENDSESKLYQMVVKALRSDILSGVFPVGAPLPSESALVARFGVSRHTAREALRHLRDLGLVETRRGVGTRVLQAGGQQLYVHHVNSIGDLHDFSLESRYFGETAKLVSTDETLAARLKTAAGESWLRINGLRYAPGQPEPICAVEIFLPARFAGIARLIGKHSGPLYGLIEALYGESIGEVEQSLRAYKIAAGDDVGLNLPVGETVVEIHRIYRLLSGDVAEITFNRYIADRFGMSMKLKRVRG
jgi:DNA-binding GntR family transcriptional regulator